MSPVKGSCLCGSVQFEITGHLGMFQYCHCSRCRKVTGTAHAANMFVAPTDFAWLQGEDLVQRFEVPQAKYYATGFCGQCGSNLPWLTKTQSAVVIPAGSLDDEPPLKPQANAFWASRAPWFCETSELPKFDELPNKK